MLLNLEGEAATFALELARVAGVVVAAPILWTDAPVRVRAAVVVLFGVLAHSVHAGALVTPESAMMSGPFELLMGLGMGMVVRFSLSIAEMVGDLFAPIFGLTGAQLFDPHQTAPESGLGRALRLVIGLIALAVGVHRVLIGALLASFTVIPVGTPLEPGLAAAPLFEMSAGIIQLGTRIAIPIIAVHMVTQVALAFVSRAAPAMQIFSIGFAVSLVVGLFVLLLVFPDIAREITADLSHTESRIEAVVLAMAMR